MFIFGSEWHRDVVHVGWQKNVQPFSTLGCIVLKSFMSPRVHDLRLWVNPLVLAFNLFICPMYADAGYNCCCSSRAFFHLVYLYVSPENSSMRTEPKLDLGRSICCSRRPWSVTTCYNHMEENSARCPVPVLSKGGCTGAVRQNTSWCHWSLHHELSVRSMHLNRQRLRDDALKRIAAKRVFCGKRYSRKPRWCPHRSERMRSG